MDSPETTQPQPPVEQGDEARAREYEAVHNRLFLVRVVLTLLILAVYLFTGASARLAEGLAQGFGGWWPVTNGVYLILTIFGFSAITFPLSLYSDYMVEREYEVSKQEFGGWLADYFKTLGIEILLGTVFFEIVYALLHWTPMFWWVWATIAYILLAVVLTTLAPVWIMPLFHKFEPLAESELTESVKNFVQSAGLKVLGVFKWGLEEKTVTANAALTGLGKTRRIILGDTMLNGYSKEEIIAVLAHEVGHYKNRDIVRLMLAGSILAAIGFYLAHVCLTILVPRFGFQNVGEIGAFPIFMFCLFMFSLITMPVGNGYSRRREFAADEYAVRAVGSAGALVSALEKLASQNLADKSPAPWIEFLLHGHPSISRRVQRAKEVEKGLTAKTM